MPRGAWKGGAGGWEPRATRSEMMAKPLYSISLVNSSLPWVSFPVRLPNCAVLPWFTVWCVQASTSANASGSCAMMAELPARA